MSHKAIIMGRVPWLDALRALAIIFVVFGHDVQWWNGFFVYTSPIKIPLFFIISGFLFNVKGGDTKEFMLGLFNRIVLPYVLLALISVVFFIPFSGLYAFPSNFLKIFSGELYWFMPCLIFGEVILFFILKTVRNTAISTLLSVIIFVLGSFLVKEGILGFGMLNIALEIQLFIYIGTLIRNLFSFISKIPNSVLWLLPVFYVLLCYYGDRCNLTTGFDPHIGNYGFLPYTLFVILLGNITLFCLASQYSRWPRFLLFIGQNTLILYLWANWGKTLLFGLMRILRIAKPVHSIGFALVCLLSSIIFCSVCSLVLNKYMPFLVGKK